MHKFLDKYFLGMKILVRANRCILPAGLWPHAYGRSDSDPGTSRYVSQCSASKNKNGSKKNDLKTDSFAVFQISRFVTTER